jgi:glycosyltransferase involved in cell wall biosynthesis
MKFLLIFLLMSSIFGAPSVSFNFLTKNDGKYLYDTFKFIKENVLVDHEIIVIDDYSNNQESLDYLDRAVLDFGIILKQNYLNKDFSQQRNLAISLSSKEYIFVIDSDERPAKILIKSLDKILSSNRDAYSVPRAHYVENLPINHPLLDFNGRVAWPDYAIRIFRNHKNIKWIENVHERITGFLTQEWLPQDENFSIIEEKNYQKWKNSHLFYLTCFEEQIYQCLLAKNYQKTFELFLFSPTEHINFLTKERFSIFKEDLKFSDEDINKIALLILNTETSKKRDVCSDLIKKLFGKAGILI